jgi:hypothetical protein
MKKGWWVNLAVAGAGLAILLAFHLSDRSQYLDWAMFDWAEQHPWRQPVVPANSAFVNRTWRPFPETHMALNGRGRGRCLRP